MPVLESLSVKNYALINSIQLDLQEGFTVFSGETGAGKSILVGALSLLLGTKVDNRIIRKDADETIVSAQFLVESNRPLQEWLMEKEITPQDGRVLVRRNVKRNGRSNAFISSVSVTVRELMEFASFVVDLHSQHEHQSLFFPNIQRSILDRYAGIEERVQMFSQSFTRVTSLREELKNLKEKEKSREQEIAVLQYAIEEIDSAKTTPVEEEEVGKELDRLNSHENLTEALHQVVEMLGSDKEGGLLILRQLQRVLSPISALDERIGALMKRLEEVYYETEDIAQEAARYRDGIVFSSERKEHLEDRLGVLERLKRKYGKTLEEVLNYRRDAEETLEKLRQSDEETDRLQREVDEGEKELVLEAKKISQIRSTACVKLEPDVQEILHKLGMKSAVFQVELAERRNAEGNLSCGPAGIDNVSFLIAANTGESVMPIRNVASGGELSRIMLAIKSVFAESDVVPTLIFDEIDAGIGGEVGVGVADYLHQLSNHKQVLCITHLASIALKADIQYAVEKTIELGRTVTKVREVKDDKRVLEISRMLAGDRAEDHSQEYARTLLERRNKSWHAGN